MGSVCDRPADDAAGGRRRKQRFDTPGDDPSRLTIAVVLTGNVLCYRDGGIENEKELRTGQQ
jgi:hypothetical protein